MSSPSAQPHSESHMPAVLTAAIAALFLLAVPFIVLRSTEGRAAPASDAATDELIEGQKVYHRNCQGCHEARGTGRPGKYPSLVGAPWLLDDRDTAIRVVLLGVTGPMQADGRKYDSVMPNFGVNLTDLDVARMLTFARQSWGNKGEPVQAADVARVRAELGSRTAPWAGEAELIGAREKAKAGKGP